MNADLFVTTRIQNATATDSGFIIEGIANDATETDSFKTRFRWTDDCINRSIGGTLLFNHDANLIAGRNLEMDRRSDGSLWVRDEVDLTPQMENGLTYSDAIKRGYLNGLSIRFDPDALFIRGKEFDTIVPNIIPEHSITPLPANRASRISEFTRSILSKLEREPEGQEIAGAFRLMVDGLKGDPMPDQRTSPKHFEKLNLMRAAGPLEFGLLYRRLNEALSDMKEYDWECGIAAVMDDSVIISCDWGAYFYKHAYTVDADGNVAIAPERTEVLPMWREVNAGSSANPAEADETVDAAPKTGNDVMLDRAALSDALRSSLRLSPPVAAQPITLVTLRAELRSRFS